MLPVRCRLVLWDRLVGDLSGGVSQTWSSSSLKAPLGEGDLGER